MDAGIKKRGSAGILNRETPRTLETAIIKIQRFQKKIKRLAIKILFFRHVRPVGPVGDQAVLRKVYPMNYLALTSDVGESPGVIRDENGVPVEWTLLKVGDNPICHGSEF